MLKKTVYFVLSSLIVLILFEILSYNVLVNRYKNVIVGYNAIIARTQGKAVSNKFKLLIPYSKVTQPKRKDYEKRMRPVEFRDKNKRPIILFGCSFTEGFGLKNNENFSKKLADYTNRTVYNRGLSGTGIPFMYYQLKNKKVLKYLPKNAEYIIYTLIPDHFPRLFRYRNFVLTGDHTLRYKIKNKKLVREKLLFPFIHSLYTTIILEEYNYTRNSQDIKKVKKLSYKLFYESYRKIKESFPNAKFVIIYYKEPLFQGAPIFDEILKKVQKIDEQNIKIIYINNLIPELYEREYWLEDNGHPSAKAWDKIVPVISKELNLN